MCGIYGKLFLTRETSLSSFLEDFNKISHRGPDGDGVWYSNKTASELVLNPNSKYDISEDGRTFINAMGHKRLSIIDLSDDGLQPFTKDNIILTFNGEVFNYLSLKAELESKGYTFKTKTDTEVVLYSYIEWGVDCFKKFNGMWAIAIYDTISEELLLSRDRFGIKPLYYSISNSVTYSSEIKALSVENVNFEHLASFIDSNIVDHNTDTFYDNVFQVSPGTCLIINKSLECIVHEYFNLEEELIEHNDVTNNEIYKTLYSSLQLRNQADVEVGGLLSGGIDSSIIAGLTKSISEDNSYHGFSAVFGTDDNCEKKYIVETEKYLDIDVKYIYPNKEGFSENIREQVYIQESPLRSMAVTFQSDIYKYIRENTDVRVVLNGQGADEIFSGYHEHILCYFLDLIKESKFSVLYSEVKCYAKIRNVSSFKLLISIVNILSKGVGGDILKRKVVSLPYKKNKKPETLKGRLKYNLLCSALPEYLRYEDRNSMANGIEARLPFLDYRLVVKALSLPETDLICGGVAKQPLRKIASLNNLVSPSILSRKDKTGFVSPQETYMKEYLWSEMIEELKWLSMNNNFLDLNSINNIIEKMKSEKSNLDYNLIFRLYTTAIWAKTYKVSLYA
ncbi:asparagine synthase (glutamine-hydrolyzing) [Vibrio splendidus]